VLPQNTWRNEALAIGNVRACRDKAGGCEKRQGSTSAASTPAHEAQRRSSVCTCCTSRIPPTGRTPSPPARQPSSSLPTLECGLSASALQVRKPRRPTYKVDKVPASIRLSCIRSSRQPAMRAKNAEPASSLGAWSPIAGAKVSYAARRGRPGAAEQSRAPRDRFAVRQEHGTGGAALAPPARHIRHPEVGPVGAHRGELRRLRLRSHRRRHGARGQPRHRRTRRPRPRHRRPNTLAELVPFLQFDRKIRTIICIADAIESVNARIRGAVNAQGHFPTEQAALK
jgi:hypothetical protein